MANLTPMMQQYMDIKDNYRDCILFYRLGDFYEMFFDDALTASRELEITLTGRDCGMSERAPMCGVPFHSADNYISRLINKGFKVAICEQVEDAAVAKGIVKREVIKVVTPGTVTDLTMLDDRKNNYLMCIYCNKIYFGISIVDISTGEFSSTQINWGNSENKLMDEIAKYSPSEIIVNNELYSNTQLVKNIKDRFNVYISPLEDEYFLIENARVKISDNFGEESISPNIYDLYINSSGALLAYLEQTQKVNLDHIGELNLYKIEEYMVLDVATRRNLELTETMREKKRKGTLLWVIDKTMTSMGGRTIRKWIDQPLIKEGDIKERLEAVSEFKDKYMVRMEARELLKNVYDIERLLSKVILGSINCRDLIALKNSIGQIPYIKNVIKDCSSALIEKNNFRLDSLKDVFDLIEVSIIDEPPITIKEGNIIKDGYNGEVDKLRRATKEGKGWIAELENSQREKTGIKNLKVGFNKVFGYYLEVTKSYYSLVPDYYIRKQTLANCERYIIEDLKEIENTILGAEEKVVELEYKLFIEIKEKIASQVDRIKSTALSLAEIDVISSLAEVADRENYCMPNIQNEGEISIIEGRHPVVEKMQNENSFISNDTILDLDENRLSIITGPNMAGKSTYMRQVALIVLMAQIGSFVPATSANIGIVDRIFTRVGASDDLASGQSTFMVEMIEVANILQNASNKSLLILDEIGRGTSTFDGLSIAWSVVEYISDSNKLGCRTLFATHYHELTELEDKLNGVKNYCISVKKKGEDIIFLRKIIRGGADESFGIQVAKLAGVPQIVINRAKEILIDLEEADINKNKKARKKIIKPIDGQMDLMTFNSISKSNDDVLEEIRILDATALTPLDALNLLYSLQQKLIKGK